MAAKADQIQREHLTDADWAKFCRFMEVTVKLKAKLRARRELQAMRNEH